ncbi:MAG: DinB family protein [Acidobacteria bacterium]|nr:DinB family protein [Acidobacteriota bacterium]MCI0721249.1 DinB family protein [Acidobacteriota bacterium]
MQSTLDDFKSTLDQAPVQLSKIADSDSGKIPSAGKWSKKQVLGHLIDSAANNHQRFVRAQLGQELAFPGYEQEGWVAVQHYQEESWSTLIELWHSYNRHLLHVMARVPPNKINHRCAIGSSNPVTLEFLMKDYVVHMKHHLRQVLE